MESSNLVLKKNKHKALKLLQPIRANLESE